MKLHPTTVVQHELHKELATALDAPSTLVFADTNVLFWLFSLGSGPRADFLKWAHDQLGARFLIPVWAAHELYGYLRGKQAKLTPLKTSVKGLENALGLVKADIALAADERHLRDHTDVGSYLAEVDRVGRDLVRLCSQTPTSTWEELAAEIIPFVNGHVLDSNIFPMLRWVDVEVAARIEGRIPPGFEDRAKEDNKFGDRMLWNEIVERCRTQTEPGAVIVLTNDQKPDWVYRPAGVQDAAGGRQKNDKEYETVLPSPLLVHELTSLSKMTDLHLVNVETLVVVMHRFANRSIPQLFRAVQPLIAPTAEELAARTTRARPRRAPPAAGAGEEAPPALAVTLATLADLRQPPPEPRAAFAETVADLSSQDPFRQEQAVNRLSDPFEPQLSASEWFALGRALHAAGASGVQSALNAIGVLGAGEAPSTEDVTLFAGVLHGLYFANDGSQRRLPLGAASDVILRASERASLAPAVTLVSAELRQHAAGYLALPLPGQRPKVTVTLELERTSNRSPVLLGMRTGERELIEDIEPEEKDALTSFIAPAKSDGFGRGNVLQLRQATATRYSVPQQWLEFQEPDNTIIKWSSTKGFQRL